MAMTNAAVDATTRGPSGLIRARAPLRISFSGGGTDLMPYAAEHGGCVLSATVDLYAYADALPRTDRVYNIASADGSKLSGLPEEWVLDGELDLVKGCLRHLVPQEGVEMSVGCDAPASSGLGSSSALVVAILAATAELTGTRLGPYDLAQRAYHVERKDLAQPGGMQDQYAAAFGGFNYMEFHGEDDVTVTPLRVAPELVHELHRSLLLCYLGPRERGDLIDLQVESYREGRPDPIQALSAIKDLTSEVREALLAAELPRFAYALDEEWRQKQRLAEGITDQRIQDMEERARSAGAIAAKVLGAGGGGHLLLFVPPERRARVSAALSAGGGRLVDFQFVHRGAETWWAR